ncbi:MAG: hypothetical protein IPI93_09345 [Sphingobacteriaceae bacterium]|nr:hypothetical protein [Sphingobacteriaceae bacterium]
MYPKSDVAPLSKDILNSIKNKKSEAFSDAPKIKVMGKDTFQINFINQHFMLHCALMIQKLRIA